jgi:hypothetical protein
VQRNVELPLSGFSLGPGGIHNESTPLRIVDISISRNET